MRSGGFLTRVLLAILVPLLLPAAVADDVVAPAPRVWLEGSTVVLGAAWCPIVTDGSPEPCSQPEAWATTNTTDPMDTHVVVAFCVWGLVNACTPYI